MSRVMPLVQWYGGKARLAPIIAEKMPAHRVYVEPFGGAAGVLLAKQPSEIEVYNDLNQGIVNLFRVVRNPEQCQKLIDLLELTPYARDEWRDCNKTWETETDPIEKARKFYVVLNQGFVGQPSGGSWSFGGSKKPNNNKAVTFYNGLLEIAPVHKRFQNVLVENAPALNIMRQWDSTETMIYVDPPYLPGTRNSKNNYSHELTTNDHIELLDWLLQAKSMIILSGYPSALYSEKLEANGWVREDFKCIASSSLQSVGNGLKGKPAKQAERTECLWFNPAAKPRTLWECVG